MAKTRDRRIGEYLIKRVETLPDNGSGNFLYTLLKENFSKLYRWKRKGVYEEIPLYTENNENFHNNKIVVKELEDLLYEDGTKAISEEIILDHINSETFYITEEIVPLVKFRVKQPNPSYPPNRISRYHLYTEYVYTINTGKGTYGLNNTPLTLEDITRISRTEPQSVNLIFGRVENATNSNVAGKMLDLFNNLNPPVYIRPNEIKGMESYYYQNGIRYKEVRIVRHSDTTIGVGQEPLKPLDIDIWIQNQPLTDEQVTDITVDLGDIGSSTPSDFINNLQFLEYLDEGYFIEATQNGDDKVWYFNADSAGAGNYGQNGLTSAETDFELLSNEDTPDNPSNNQDNISRTIEIQSADLSGNGSIEEQIVEYINNLNYEKTEIEGDTFVKLVPSKLRIFTKQFTKQFT